MIHGSGEAGLIRMADKGGRPHPQPLRGANIGCADIMRGASIGYADIPSIPTAPPPPPLRGANIGCADSPVRGRGGVEGAMNCARTRTGLVRARCIAPPEQTIV